MLIVLALLHATAAMQHHFIDHDPKLVRMLKPNSGKSPGPHNPSPPCAAIQKETGP
jgi:hypothetical protein